MKKFLRSTTFCLFLLLGLFFLAAEIFAAYSPCEDTYGGQCITWGSSCPAERPNDLGGWLDRQGCPAINKCCVPNCASGATCVAPEKCESQSSGTPCNSSGGICCSKPAQSECAKRRGTCMQLSDEKAAELEKTGGTPCGEKAESAGRLDCEIRHFCCVPKETPATQPNTPSTPSTTTGNPASNPTSEHPFNYTSATGVSSFTSLIVKVLGTIQSAAGWLAVIFVVVGAIMYIVSAGTGLANTAKATITWALVGFALAVAGPSFLKEIYEVATSGGASGASLIDQAPPLQRIVAKVLTFLLTTVGLLATIGFVISGILFATSAGNTQQAGTASKAMGYTILGIVIAGAGLIIVNQVIRLSMGGQ